MRNTWPYTRRAWCLATGSALLADHVFAAALAVSTAAATAPPTEVASSVSAARLQGRGTLRYFGLRVYEARLWAGPGFAAESYTDQTFALELEYARGFAGGAIAQRSIDEMRRSAIVANGQAREWQAAMVRAFPDVAPGDRLTGIHAPGAATHFFHNGRPTTPVAGPEFARLFFGIWLAESTSEPALRRQLIGAGL
jgi:hypothetical protein